MSSAYNVNLMNGLLERIGADDRVKAGEVVHVPPFFDLFTHILDRLDAMERDIERLREEVRYPDGDPNNL